MCSILEPNSVIFELQVNAHNSQVIFLTDV